MAYSEDLPHGASDWKIEVYRSFAEVEAVWRAFAQAACGSAYQGFDWASAWGETLGAAGAAAPAIVVVRDGTERIVALLPFCVRRWRALGIVEFIGGKHANFNMPLFDPRRFGFGECCQSKAFLRRVAEHIGDVDLYVLRNQPHEWQGTANPLAACAGPPSASGGYKAALKPDPEAFLRTILSSETRKKLRKKQRLLGEGGKLATLQASTPEEVRRVLAAFHAQKADRMRDRALDNPFDAPGAAEFLERGCLAGLESGRPAIRLYALMLDERIVATFGGAEGGGRFCGMFNSFDTDPAISKHSPGDLLLTELIARCCRAGLATFDLGIGEAPYKRTYCKQRESVFDTILPASPAGALLAVAYRLAVPAKRLAKRLPGLGRARAAAKVAMSLVG